MFPVFSYKSCNFSSLLFPVLDPPSPALPSDKLYRQLLLIWLEVFAGCLPAHQPLPPTSKGVRPGGLDVVWGILSYVAKVHCKNLKKKICFFSRPTGSKVTNRGLTKGQNLVFWWKWVENNKHANNLTVFNNCMNFCKCFLAISLCEDTEFVDALLMNIKDHMCFGASPSCMLWRYRGVIFWYFLY